jgi:DNA polymerase III alpha subunit (gram-positive type)
LTNLINILQYKSTPIVKRISFDIQDFTFTKKNNLMENKKYIVLDLETTGLSKYKHQITEIAAIKIDGDKII